MLTKFHKHVFYINFGAKKILKKRPGAYIFPIIQIKFQFFADNWNKIDDLICDATWGFCVSF